MVLEPEILEYIKNDETIFEKDPLEKLATFGELQAYKHSGFWQCMDTKAEKDKLERICDSGKAPWKNC